MDAEEQAVKLTASDTLRMGIACDVCGLTLAWGTTVCPNDGFRVTQEYVAGNDIAGKYKFIELIGTGGMSSVYKATDPVLGRTVAVKMLHQYYVNSDTMLKRFRQEGRAIGQLNHKNIVRVHEFGMLEHGQPFIVMDYIEGVSLQKFVQTLGPLSVEQAISMFKQVASALEHAHTRGILHRDLKPSNVMVAFNDSEEIHSTIVDFGIAKITEPTADSARLTTTGEIFGSPLYMSPEQCKGMQVDIRSDLYSVGCLMYEAITGKPVYEGTHPLEVLFKQMNETPLPFSERAPQLVAPQALEEIIFRTLEKEPTMRYQTAGELLQALETMQPGAASSAKPKPMPTNAAAKWMIPGAVALGAVAALTAYVVVQHQHPDNSIFDTSERQLVNPDERVHARGKSIMDARLSVPVSDPNRVTVLDLSKSDITDSGLRYLAKLHNLKTLKLNSTHIRDLNPLAENTHLSILELGNTEVTDKSLAALSELPLTHLRLNGTAITDTGASTVARFGKLTDLNLADTHITDACGPALAKLEMLYEIDVANTKIGDRFVGELPASVQYLSAENTPISDAGLAKIDRLDQLKGLYLGKSNVTDKGIANLAKVEGLTELYIESRDITDGGIQAISNLALTELSIDDSRVTDKALTVIGKMKPLRTLGLKGTAVTGRGLKQLVHCKQLESLSLHGCRGVGDDAFDALLQLKGLSFLSLTGTSVTPEGLMKLKSLTDLESLHIQDVPITPEQLAKLQSLLPGCTILSGPSR